MDVGRAAGAADDVVTGMPRELNDAGRVPIKPAAVRQAGDCAIAACELGAAGRYDAQQQLSPFEDRYVKPSLASVTGTGLFCHVSMR